MKPQPWIASVIACVLAACAAPAAPSTPAATALPAPSTPAPALPPEPEPANAILITGAGEPGEHFSARPVHPATLEDLPGYKPFELGHHYTDALSPDGRTWAVIVWSADGEWGGRLHLIDLGTWTDTTASHIFDGYVPAMKFSPDGSRLVVVANDERSFAYRSNVHLMDVATLEETTRISYDLALRQLQFSADGRQLYLYGTPPGEAADPAAHLPVVSAFEVATGRGVWSLELEGVKDGWFKTPTEDDPANVSHFLPGLAFSKDGRWLYVVSSDEDRLARVDLGAGSVESFEITEPLSWLDRLIALTASPVHAKGPVDGAEKTAVLSPDGTRLYVTGVVRDVQNPAGGQGEFQVDDVYSGLVVIDPQTGTRLGQAETSMSVFAASPDGQWLYMQRIWQWYERKIPSDAASLQVFDAASLTPEAALVPGTSWVGLELSADGSLLQVTTSHDNRPDSTMTLQLLDAQTHARLAEREITGWAIDLIMPVPGLRDPQPDTAGKPASGLP